MDKEQVLQSNLGEYSRCDKHKQKTDHRTIISKTQKTDAALKEKIRNALWNDKVLRALDDNEIDVQVINQVVYLEGHIVSSSSLNRIINALHTISGILGIKNYLVLDDKLSSQIASSLGMLEHNNDCKFFTGVTHGVVVLNGQVNSKNLRKKAEQCAANNPKVRGVINYIRVPGVELDIQDHRFLQPSIGEEIKFLDGISGTVRKVIINPDNRRVVAMIIQGHFYGVMRNLPLSKLNASQSEEQIIVIPMVATRHVNERSIFLNINSSDFTKYPEFDPSKFIVPNKDWLPPYPYCPDDILIPVKFQPVDKDIAGNPIQASSTHITGIPKWMEELLYNDSLGG